MTATMAGATGGVATAQTTPDTTNQIATADPPYTEAQNALRSKAREFAEAYIVPAAAEHDQWATYPRRIAELAKAAGLLNTSIPRAYGGPGLGVVDETIIAEEFGYGCSGIWTAFNINNLGLIPLIVGGTETQRKTWLGRVIRDGATPAFALTEPTGGSDAANMTTMARRVGSQYVLSGTKTYISNATIADFFVLFAAMAGRPSKGAVSAFIVPKDSPGLRLARRFEKAGHRAYDTSELHLEEVVLPADHLVGTEGKGFRLALAGLDHTRPLVAATAVGLARRAMTEALTHANRRHGDSLPQIQAVGHKISDMATHIEAGRLLAWRAAAELDAGRRPTRLCAMAKLFGTDLAMRCALDAAQVLGGAGIMRHSPVQKLMRDAKVLQVYDGTNEIQRNIILAELTRSSARTRSAR